MTGATFAIPIVHRHLGTPVFDFVIPTRDTLIIAALAWFLLRLIGLKLPTISLPKVKRWRKSPSHRTPHIESAADETPAPN